MNLNGDEYEPKKMLPEEYNRQVGMLTDAMFGVIRAVNASPIIASDAALSCLVRCISVIHSNHMFADIEKARAYYHIMIDAAIDQISEEELQIRMDRVNDKIDMEKKNEGSESDA